MTTGTRSRAAVVTGPGRAVVETTSVAPVAADEILVRLEGCGVCGSNVPVWVGRPWFEYPLAPGAPGHESWGRVVAVGDDVGDVAVDDRVAVLTERGFAEAAAVPAAAAVVLPSALDDEPFPGEALACGFNVARRARFEPGQTVAIVGVGFLGAVVAALARQAGARVIGITRRTYAAEVAGLMGAEHTFAGDDPAAVVGAVGELTGGALCDVVVEAVGAPGPLDLAGELTGEGGRLVVAGFHQDGRRSVDLQLWNWRGIDVINAHERDRRVVLDGIRAAADAVATRRFDPRPLYTHSFPLDRLDAAMDALVERPDGFLKALVRA